MITPEHVRSQRSGVRLSEAERRYLEGVARQSGTTLSEVIRRLIEAEARRSVCGCEKTDMRPDATVGSAYEVVG